MWPSFSATFSRHLVPSTRVVVKPSASSSKVTSHKVLGEPLSVVPSCHHPSNNNVQLPFRGASLHCLVAVRTFYFPRKNWFPWRSRLMHQRQAALRQKRHIWPRRYDDAEAPIFGGKEDGEVLAFRRKEIPIGQKKLLEYARIIRGKQIQDGIDWVESMIRMKSEPILKLLRNAAQECIEKHNMDIARVYIFDAQPQRGYVVKSIRAHARAKYGINKSPRHMFMVRVREMPLEEYFHRVYVFNRVPRSLASDMRLALHENRVNPQVAKDWAPYLCASSRHAHRHELKWLDSTRQFDYYKARHEWIQRYRANLFRNSTEAREARGLPPLVAE
jgi:ribosomal protein L22